MKRHTPEQAISKLRQAEADLAQGLVDRDQAPEDRHKGLAETKDRCKSQA